MVTVVATVNAVNFVDGLDGLAAGVIGVGAVAFFVFCYQLANLNGVSLAVTGALLCALLAGACAGFLPHNFYPARLFMGDSGSMLLGLMLSASALTLTGQFAVPTSPRAAAARRPACCPRCCRSSCRCRSWWCRSRTWCWPSYAAPGAGQMFYHPDKQHLHHRMLEIGHSHRRAVLIMWLWAGLIGFGTVVGSLYAGRLTYLAPGRVVRGHRGCSRSWSRGCADCTRWSSSAAPGWRADRTLC